MESTSQNQKLGERERGPQARMLAASWVPAPTGLWSSASDPQVAGRTQPYAWVWLTTLWGRAASCPEGSGRGAHGTDGPFTD